MLHLCLIRKHNIMFYLFKTNLTQQVFLTWRAIYVLTFDLSKDLDEKVADEKLRSKISGKVRMYTCMTCLRLFNTYIVELVCFILYRPLLWESTEEKLQKQDYFFFIPYAYVCIYVGYGGYPVLFTFTISKISKLWLWIISLNICDVIW